MLLTADYVMDMLGIDVKGRTRVDLLIEWVQARAEAIITRKIESDTYTWYLDGNGSDTINLPVWPITSMTSVSYDWTRAFTETLETTDYEIDENTGILTFLTCEPTGRRTIKIVAVAGWTSTTVPADIKMAMLEAISWNYVRFANKAFGVMNQASPEGLTVGYEMVLPMGCERVFEMYRDIT
jgi:hypothetical protein